MNANKKPLKRSVILGCVLLILVLCLTLSVLSYFSYRGVLYDRYESHITTVLQYTAAQIDVDDLQRCIETGEKSPAFETLQTFLDREKDGMALRYLYVVVPLNTDERDNMKNVIAAVSRYEYENLADQLVRLNQLTGDAYSPETAQKYLDAFHADGISFFEEVSRWGDDYTGLMPLKNSAGEPVAALCMDVDVQELHHTLAVQIGSSVAVTLFIGFLFTLLFIIWSGENITKPIEQLESSVVAFAERAGGSSNPEELVLDLPEIHTGNEVESLSRAVDKMSQDIRESVTKIITTEQELARMNVLANKDGLTHVGNKNAYRQYVEELQRTLNTEEVEFGIVVADANHLKRINDNYGHEKGDLYLKECCGIICEIYNHSPVFRIGGDEFVVILRNRDYQNRATLLEQAVATFRHCEAREQAQPWERVSSAIGMAVYEPGVDESVESVFCRADQRMYECKAQMKAVRK